MINSYNSMPKYSFYTMNDDR